MKKFVHTQKERRLSRFGPHYWLLLILGQPATTNRSGQLKNKITIIHLYADHVYKGSFTAV